MYEKHFNFDDRPFKLSPEPKFFFSSPHHKKALSYLEYGMSLGEGFIVVTGPIGSGKTTIAKNLVAEVDSSIHVIQLVTTNLNPDELLSLVCNKFSIESQSLSKGEKLKEIEKALLQLHQAGKRALLIVDEAQNLPAETVEELRMLSNLNVNDQPLLQSFLLGQEELKSIIELPQMEQFRQRIIASCHLKALDKGQTEQYILHRLNRVGWNNSPRIDADIFAKINKVTSGIPRKINILMDRLLLAAYLEEVDTIDVALVETVIEEMHEEVSGSISPRSTEPAPKSVVAAALDNRDYQDLQRVFSELIATKLETVRQLEKLIENHQKALADAATSKVTDTVSHQTASEKVVHLNDDDSPQLAKKRWLSSLKNVNDR